ncbi:MAG: prephenate dehydratase [Pseudomonadota bacterium]
MAEHCNTEESEWAKDSASSPAANPETTPEAAPEAVTPELAAIRQGIDNIDQELLSLLNRRAELSLAVGRAKAKEGDTNKPEVIFRPQRERQVLEGLTDANSGPLTDDHLRAIWREIFSASRSLQRPQRIAYLGPEGTFSYFASVDFFGQSMIYEPQGNFTEVFRAVQDSQCDLGVVPLENSLRGSVGQSFDLFLEYNVHIHAEFYARISHCLLSKESTLGDIHTVYSHPQPLAQCDHWLRMHLPKVKIIPTESTAAAARRAQDEAGSAAIGHRSLGELCRINVLATTIEDQHQNWTRFVVIGPASPDGVAAPVALPTTTNTCGSGCADAQEKSSVLFTLPDKPGSLSAVLTLLASSGVNMTKLESRPLAGGQWHYVFFVDMECNLNAPQHAALVGTLRDLCQTLRILGSYGVGNYLDMKKS